jgi:hypothetical protein
MKQNTIRFAIIALALFFAAAFAQTAFAQWSNDPNTSALICNTNSMVNGLTSVSDGAGGVVTAWTQSATGSYELVVQRLGSDGRRLWPAAGIQITNANYYPGVSEFGVVSDGSGGAIVIVSFYFHAANPTPILIQRISNSGQALWGSTGILLRGDSASSPRILSDGSGGAIVAWAEVRNGNLGHYVQRVDGSGNLLWNANGVSVCPTAVFSWYDVNMSSDGSGGAVFVWSDGRAGSSDADIYAERISAAGVVQWLATGVPVAVIPGNQSRPILTPDGSGGVIIAWDDSRGGIYSQRINGAGAVQWALNGIQVCSASSAYSGAIVSDGSGGAVVTWTEYYQSCFEIFRAQRLNGSGTLMWPVGGIEISSCLDGGRPNGRVVNDGEGGFVAVWNKWNGNDCDVYAQRLSMTGARQWISSGVPVSTMPGALDYFWWSGSPQLVLDGRGGVIIPWSLVTGWDFGTMVRSLYAQRLNLDGTLGAPSIIANGGFEQGTANWTMYSAVPNGINFSTVPGGPSGSYTKVHINATSNNMQVYQTYFPLTAGKRYTLGFDAYSPTSRKVFVTVHKHNAPYNSYGFGEWIQLGPNWTHYERQFTAAGFSGTTSDTRLRFYFVYACGAGDDYYFDNVSLAQVLAKAGEQEIAEQPTTFLLEQNFPNPFNPTTTIRFQVPNDGHVSLKVFDMLGREVATLVNEVRDAGLYEAVFDATNLSSGMYFYKLESGSFVQAKKMIIMK